MCQHCNTLDPGTYVSPLRIYKLHAYVPVLYKIYMPVFSFYSISKSFFSTCVNGAWECSVISDCYTDIACPRNQVYLEDSKDCQTTCENYGMDCGTGYIFSGCGCPKNKTMSPDVSEMNSHLIHR